ncbi:cache domain-containing protein [Actinomadura kijaniata]|uniref:cache domain-containing protein n=1 Tax=Actinomadura kijaniata TaxID=46161 RepID=UPI000832E988|nr:cache domain-containing protein [Actinomadura kijaniata]
MTEALAQAAAASREVGDVFDAVLGSVEDLGGRAVTLIRAASRPDRAAVEPLRDDAAALIGRHAALVSGAGFVAAPGLLADAPMWLEWWQAAGTSPAERLVVDLDPASPGFYDYTRYGWFTVPRDTGRVHVHGPYVDYYGTDQYILTLSTPVLDGEGFLGIAGADLFVRRLEPSVLPPMPPGAVLVNSQGRVIVSRSARHLTGALLRGLDLGTVREAGPGEAVEGDGCVLARCGRLPLFLMSRRL